MSDESHTDRSLRENRHCDELLEYMLRVSRSIIPHVPTSNEESRSNIQQKVESILLKVLAKRQRETNDAAFESGRGKRTGNNVNCYKSHHHHAAFSFSLHTITHTRNVAYIEQTKLTTIAYNKKSLSSALIYAATAGGGGADRRGDGARIVAASADAAQRCTAQQAQ